MHVELDAKADRYLEDVRWVQGKHLNRTVTDYVDRREVSC
jgi:hypothetical protein